MQKKDNVTLLKFKFSETNAESVLYMCFNYIYEMDGHNSTFEYDTAFYISNNLHMNVRSYGGYWQSYAIEKEEDKFILLNRAMKYEKEKVLNLFEKNKLRFVVKGLDYKKIKSFVETFPTH